MNKKKLVKDYIFEALLQLMKKKDYSSISITDITNKAGVNRVSFYRNYSSKDEIILKLLEDKHNEFNENNESKDFGIYEMLKYFEYNKDIIDLLYKSHAESLFLKHILSLLKSNEKDPNIEAYIKSAWSYFMFGWANEWYLRGMKETPEELIKISEAMQKKINSI